MKSVGLILVLFIFACGGPQKPAKSVEPPRSYDIGGKTIVNSVAFSPDGSQLLAGGQNKKITLLDLSTGQIAWESPEQPDAVLSVAIAPDGKSFAATCSDNTEQTAQIVVFRMSDKAEVWGKKKLTNDAQTIRYSPDGKRLAAANFFSIFVFESETGKQEHFFSGHAADVVAPYGHVNAVTSIAWAKDPNLFVSVGWDRNVKVWDVREGHEIKTYPQSDPINSCFLSDDDGRIITGGSGALYVWNRQTDLPDTIVTVDGEIQAMVRVPSRPIFLTGDERGNLTVWNLDHLAVVKTLSGVHERGVWSIAVTNDGDKVATSGGGGRVTVWSMDYLLRSDADSSKVGS